MAGQHPQSKLPHIPLPKHDQGQITGTRAEAFIAHSTHTTQHTQLAQASVVCPAANSNWHKLDTTHTHTQTQSSQSAPNPDGPKNQVLPVHHPEGRFKQHHNRGSAACHRTEQRAAQQQPWAAGRPGSEVVLRGTIPGAKQQSSVTDLIIARGPKHRGVACKECLTSQLLDAATNRPATINRQQSAAPTSIKTRRIFQRQRTTACCLPCRGHKALRATYCATATQTPQ